VTSAEPTVGGVMRQSGPRLARDAFGPLLSFFVVWKLAGLYAGIAAAVAVGVLLYLYERHHGRPGLIVRLSLGLVLLRACVGLISGSTDAYLAQEIAIDCLLTTLFLGSVAIGRPVTELFAREIFPVPDSIRAAPEYRGLFRTITLVWGAYFLLRGCVRLAAFLALSKDAYLAVVAASDVPFLLGVLAWSVWFSARRMRRLGLDPAEFAPASRA
jgi:intracellular septation protein A